MRVTVPHGAGGRLDGTRTAAEPGGTTRSRPPRGKHSKLPSPKSDIFSRQASAVYLLTKHAEGWGSVRRKTCFDGNPGCGITAGGRRRHSIGVAAGALAIALVTALPTHTASTSQVSMATAASFGQLAGAGRAAGSAAGAGEGGGLAVGVVGH